MSFSIGRVLLMVGALLVFTGALFFFLLAGQSGYSPRAMVSEGLSLAGGAKAAVSEFYEGNGRFPDNNDEAGLAPATSINGKYASSVMVSRDGRIRVRFDMPEAHKRIRGKSLVLQAGILPDGRLEWLCEGAGLESRDLPAACRR